jgi:hypothetical protein
MRRTRRGENSIDHAGDAVSRTGEVEVEGGTAPSSSRSSSVFSVFSVVKSFESIVGTCRGRPQDDQLGQRLATSERRDGAEVKNEESYGE